MQRGAEVNPWTGERIDTRDEMTVIRHRNQLRLAAIAPPPPPVPLEVGDYRWAHEADKAETERLANLPKGHPRRRQFFLESEDE